MVFTAYAHCPAACGVLSLLLLLAAPPSVAGEVLDLPSRGEDNRTERGIEALTGEGAWTGTLTQPAASKAPSPLPHVANRPKVSAAAKKLRERVKPSVVARREKSELSHSTMNLEQIRRAVYSPTGN